MLELMNLIAKGKKSSFTGEEVQKLLASDGVLGDRFGVSVAISSDSSVLVVGAPYDDDKGNDSGSVYVYTKQPNGSYIESQKLTASDGAVNDYFGRSVAVNADGSVIVVSAYFDDDKGTDSGSVYVFTKQSSGSYLQSHKLTASDGAANDNFGFSISVSSDSSVLVVGSYGDDDKGTNSGSVYVFTKQTNGNYIQSQKLRASDGADRDWFGYSVSISGDSSTIVVGAYCDDNNSGSAYVFTKQSSGSYLQSHKLTAFDRAASDLFGYSVSISSDSSVLVVGAHADDDKGTNSGSVYVFTKQSSGSYLQSQKLTASDGAEGDLFGQSVSVSGDGSVIVVGACRDDDKGTDSGSVYVFTKQSSGSYLQSHKLTASDGAANDNFGFSISVSSDSSVLVVGAPYDDDKGNDSGSTYVFN